MTDTIENDISNLSKAMTVVRKQTAAMRDTLKKVWARIDELEDQHKHLLMQPITRADWLTYCMAYVDSRAKEYAEFLADYLFRIPAQTQRNDRFEVSMGTLNAVLRKQVAAGGNLYVLSGGAHRMIDEGPFSGGAPWYFFRDQIKEGIRSAFELMPSEWHFQDAKGLDAVFPILDMIESELNELKRQEQKLHEQAEQFGISLPEKPERSGVPVYRRDEVPARTVQAVAVHGAP